MKYKKSRRALVSLPNGVWKVIDEETISDLSVAVGLTASCITAEVEWASVQAIDGDVRFTLKSGRVPVAATTGKRIVQDGLLELWGHNEMKNFLAIDDGGTAKLEISYHGRG